MEKAELCRALMDGFLPAAQPALLGWACASVPTVFVQHTQTQLQILLLLLTGCDFGKSFKVLESLFPFMTDEGSTAATWGRGGGQNLTRDPPGAKKGHLTGSINVWLCLTQNLAGGRRLLESLPR